MNKEWARRYFIVGIQHKEGAVTKEGERTNTLWIMRSWLSVEWPRRKSYGTVQYWGEVWPFDLKKIVQTFGYCNDVSWHGCKVDFLYIQSFSSGLLPTHINLCYLGFYYHALSLQSCFESNCNELNWLGPSLFVIAVNTVFFAHLHTPTMNRCECSIGLKLDTSI